MDHGQSWLSLLPGFQNLQEYMRTLPGGVGILGNAMVLQHVAAGLLVSLVVLIVSMQARRELKNTAGRGLVPSPSVSVGNVICVILEKLAQQMRAIIGKDWARYFPLIATLALFILFSNLLGLIPGFLPPTDNWNTTFACSIIVFLYYQYQGLRVNGWHHLAHLANPVGTWWGWFLAPLFFPIELVQHFGRPFSLAVRLATNMIADHALLVLFLGLCPILVPIPFLFLGLMVSVIQTAVFVLLSIVYIALAVQQLHHDDCHAAA